MAKPTVTDVYEARDRFIADLNDLISTTLGLKDRDDPIVYGSAAVLARAADHGLFTLMGMLGNVAGFPATDCRSIDGFEAELRAKSEREPDHSAIADLADYRRKIAMGG